MSMLARAEAIPPSSRGTSTVFPPDGIVVNIRVRCRRPKTSDGHLLHGRPKSDRQGELYTASSSTDDDKDIVDSMSTSPGFGTA